MVQPHEISSDNLLASSSLSVPDGEDVGIFRAGETESSEQLPLDLRVIHAVRSAAVCDESGMLCIRPARLASELGELSVNDACAELCGLMAAVGQEASFTFEDIAVGEESTTQKQKVMVFRFPPNFEKLAMWKRRRQDFLQMLYGACIIVVKILKIIAAFGLILSLLILSVAAIIALVAVLVAVARSGSGRDQQGRIIRQVRAFFFTIRQLLWCYAMFGPEGDDQDPFLREIAHDSALVMSVCCGSPAGIFYWMRAHQLARRRHRLFQGWGRRNDPSMHSEEEIEGVRIMSRNRSPSSRGYREQDSGVLDSSSALSISQSTDHRGLLSLAVEFLFGPTPFNPGPSQSKRWKLRAGVIVQIATNNKNRGSRASVALKCLAPFVDYPPHNDDSILIENQSMLIVAHFNGVPSPETSLSSLSNMADAKFDFPELMAESADASPYQVELFPEVENSDWASLLFEKESASSMEGVSLVGLPDHLTEYSYRLTKLTASQFRHCAIAGILNLVGVFWLKQSLLPGGILEIDAGSPLHAILLTGLLPVLGFYSVLFFAIPFGRLALILALNWLRWKRNERREAFAKALDDTFVM